MEKSLTKNDKCPTLSACRKKSPGKSGLGTLSGDLGRIELLLEHDRMCAKVSRNFSRSFLGIFRGKPVLTTKWANFLFKATDMYRVLKINASREMERN